LRDAARDEASEGTAAEVLGRVSDALRVEAAAYRGLLEELDDHSRRGLHAALALAIVLPAFALAFATFFHRRVLVPLNDLTYLMGLLARKDYVAAATEDIDPLMRPLFEKYNRMVKRMHDMEQGHLKREDSLQRDVDQATRALVQQQLALSRVERLAAVGEISARLVHELRNPLSGVLMALTNLRGEIQSEDQDERLKLAIAELERIAHLLSNVVEDVRQIPERPRWLRLADVVGDLLTLVRYQLDDHIELVADVPPDLRCRLPESGLRHALLNLVLNASQAMGERVGTIRIAARREDDVLIITVSDDGPGFPEALLAAGVHDFGAWRRGGTGLGLATVRRFVLAHAGRLRLDNRAEGGARVTLHLPLEETDG
jgi:signal transduction histidine kinase